MVFVVFARVGPSLWWRRLFCDEGPPGIRFDGVVRGDSRGSVGVREVSARKITRRRDNSPWIHASREDRVAGFMKEVKFAGFVGFVLMGVARGWRVLDGSNRGSWRGPLAVRKIRGGLAS